MCVLKCFRAGEGVQRCAQVSGLYRVWKNSPTTNSKNSSTLGCAPVVPTVDAEVAPLERLGPAAVDGEDGALWEGAARLLPLAYPESDDEALGPSAGSEDSKRPPAVRRRCDRGRLS